MGIFCTDNSIKGKCRHFLEFAIIISFLSMLSTGCASEKASLTTAMQSESIVESTGSIQLYHIDGMSIVPDRERYQLKQPDSLPASLEEIMTVAQIPEGVTFDGYRIDENGGIRLDISVEDDVSDEELLMAKAMIVRCLNELSNVQDIGIAITRTSIVDGSKDKRTKYTEKVDTATYTDSSFFYYDDAKDSAVNTGDVVLYLPNGQGSLKKVIANVTIGADDSAPESVLSQLQAYDVLPEGTEINQVLFMNGSATVDFSKEFVDENSSISPAIIIYSIVDSLTSLPNIDKVQILVDGEKVENYRGISIGGPMKFTEFEH